VNHKTISNIGMITIKWEIVNLKVCSILMLRNWLYFEPYTINSFNNITNF
jgi:hypothetical protein